MVTNKERPPRAWPSPPLEEKEETKDSEEGGKVIVTGFHGFEIEYNGKFVTVKYKGESIKGIIKASVAAFDPEGMGYMISVLPLRIICEDAQNE